LALYLDSSALVKLVAEEPESVVLRSFVDEAPWPLVSSQIAAVEVPRAARRHGAERRGRELLDRLLQIDIEPSLLDAAAEANPVTLSSLDALHLVSALAHRERIEHFVAYDVRLVEAAQANGLNVASPA
jgi:predicted nucleic acid-binding protein